MEKYLNAESLRHSDQDVFIVIYHSRRRTRCINYYVAPIGILARS